MKKYKNILLLVLIGFSLSSCYKEEYFLDDNVTSDGKHFPIVNVIADVKSRGSYHIDEVSMVKDVNVLYWSHDQIKQISTYQSISHLGSNTNEFLSTRAYSYMYDESVGMESFLFDYTPPLVEAQTTIEVALEVENENGLSKFASFKMYYDVVLTVERDKKKMLKDTVLFKYKFWSGTAIDAINLVQYTKKLGDETKLDTLLVFTVPVRPSFSGGFKLDSITVKQKLPNPVPSQVPVPSDSLVLYEVQLINNGQADKIKSSFSYKIEK